MNHIEHIRTVLGTNKKIITFIQNESPKFEHKHETEIYHLINNTNIDTNTDIKSKVNEIRRYSNDKLFINYLESINLKTDILVIDDIIDKNIEKFVNKNGYIINNKGIDFANTELLDMYKNNTILYKPSKTKLDKKIYYDNDIKFAIVISTFHRKSGKTKNYIERCLESVLIQKYKNWDIIIVGDKYEPESEIFSIIEDTKKKMMPNNKIIYVPTNDPPREYIFDKYKLWCVASSVCLNAGLKYVRENGYKYYVHTDDDDFWTSEHLLSLYYAYKKYPNCVFAHTKSTYGNIFLPRIDCGIYPGNIRVCGGTIIHSSISFRADIIPINYFITKNEEDIKTPADFLLLEDLRGFLEKNPKYCSIFTGKLTCYHDEEGSLRV